jgi:hypothetical protein
MNTRTLTCEEFSEGLGDYIDETSGAAARAAMDAHAATCAACAALLNDVRSLVAEARALPELAPSRDLWQGIEARIAAPVIALDAGAARVGRGARRRSIGRVWMAAAAAALVVATAGITFTATKWMYMDAAASPSVAATPAPDSPSGTDAPGTRGDAGDALPVPATRVAGTPDAAAIAPRRDATAGSGAPAALPVAMTAAEATFDLEIGQLRAVLEQRRAELDPATVAILEHNLDVIDQAIEQSRAALARDPADRFLTEQLNSTLGKKVELLRTAAMLPARI